MVAAQTPHFRDRYNQPMPSEFPIHDMLVFPLHPSSGPLTLLRNRDHLLRRFGQLDLIDLDAGEQTEATLRGEADRFYFCIQGRVTVTLLDLREHSPSLGAQARLTLDAKQPQGLLAPFGVACSLAAETDARLVLLSTHSEEHPQDRVACAEELGQFAGLQ